MLSGRCHCGAIRYEMPEEAIHQALCHCDDCRRHAGAPVVAWAMVPAGGVKIDGTPQVYASSEHGKRHFCGACGTSLFYTNESMLPGMMDVQTATLDAPEKLPPKAEIQIAERIVWMTPIGDLPQFERFPGQG
ncbi:MAG: GFA family protein [Sphingobium sp.]|nr:GFA family protein [Sphingobium sp.]